MDDLRICHGCGCGFPASDGPTHRYIGASAGCWQLFTSIGGGAPPDPILLARSRVPPPVRTPIAVRPADLHKPGDLGALFADAYAIQHHGDHSPQAVQSVAVHLLTLHGVLARGLKVSSALWVRRQALRERGVFVQLEPPPLGQALTIRHLFPGGGVIDAATPADYVSSVYEVWVALHGPLVDDWYERFVL